MKTIALIIFLVCLTQLLFSQGNRGGQYFGFAPQNTPIIDVTSTYKLFENTHNTRSTQQHSNSKSHNETIISYSKLLKSNWMSYSKYPSTIPDGKHNAYVTNSLDYFGQLIVYVEKNKVVKLNEEGTILHVELSNQITNGRSEIKLYNIKGLYEVIFIEYLESYNKKERTEYDFLDKKHNNVGFGRAATRANKDFDRNDYPQDKKEEQMIGPTIP